MILKAKSASTLAGLGDPTSLLREIAAPTYGPHGELIRNIGHSTVFEHNGKYFIMYHIGVFEHGKLIRRDVYISPLEFDANGDILPLKNHPVGRSGDAKRGEAVVMAAGRDMAESK